MSVGEIALCARWVMPAPRRISPVGAMVSAFREKGAPFRKLRCLKEPVDTRQNPLNKSDIKQKCEVINARHYLLIK